jgi:flagellar protein FlaF
MGFSVSGATAVIFVAGLIGFGMFYTASANGFEAVTESRESVNERTLERMNTGINLTQTVYNDSNGDLAIAVNNTGARTLSVNDTDLIVDNDYVTDPDASVNGDRTTDLWLPGERLWLNTTVTDPNRIVVTTERGVQETAVV